MAKPSQVANDPAYGSAASTPPSQPIDSADVAPAALAPESSAESGPVAWFGTIDPVSFDVTADEIEADSIQVNGEPNPLPEGIVVLPTDPPTPSSATPAHSPARSDSVREMPKTPSVLGRLVARVMPKDREANLVEVDASDPPATAPTVTVGNQPRRTGLLTLVIPALRDAGRKADPESTPADEFATSSELVAIDEMESLPTPNESVEEVMEVEIANASPVVALGVPIGLPGVGPDEPGLADNVSARIGGTGYRNDNSASAGILALLESSKQLGDSALFLHGGAGTEYLNGEWPVSYSVGFSKLARIEGNEVTHPLVLAFAYDAYFDSEFFQTDDTVYLDQFRFLVGHAITPYSDIGVWSSLGLQSDFGRQVTPTGSSLVHSRLGDRIAAYFARDFGARNNHLIWSAGWEEDPSAFFTEADLFVPLTDGVNLFAGAGYSAAGSWDAVAGLELALGNLGRRMFRRQRRAVPTEEPGAVQLASYDDCDPCDADPCAAVCACSVCCLPRFRGGWANDDYRGALRVITPSRMRRMLSDPAPRFLPAAITAGPTATDVGATTPPPAPPAPSAPPDPPAQISTPTPIECEIPTTTHPREEPLPRWTQRPTRASRLSMLLDSLP